MCLIALAWHAHSDFDLVLAGNRDEFHARPAAPLAFDSRHGIAGGIDLQAGGRWLGLSITGRFAAVTNVRRGVPESPRPASRGALVERMLGSERPVLDELQGLAPDAGRYARFNLLASDDQALCYAGNADGWTLAPVDEGLHTLSNATLDIPWPKTRRLRAALEATLAGLHGAPDRHFVDAMLDALRSPEAADDHELPDTGIGLDRERALSSAFVALGPYGTRCSSLVLRRGDGRWWFIEQRYDPLGAPSGRTTLAGNQRGLLSRQEA